MNPDQLVQYAPWLLVAAGIAFFLYNSQKNKTTSVVPPVIVKPADPQTAPYKVEPKPEAPKEDPKPDTKIEAEVKKATEALDGAGIKGTEYLQTISSVRHGFVTGDEVAKAHKKD